MRKMLILALALLLSGCSLPYPTHDVSVLRSIEKRPDESAGAILAFRGDVIEVRETSTCTQIQVIVGQSFSEYRADLGDVLFCEFPRRSSVIKGDSISVLGTPSGMVFGENMFGGSVRALRFDTYAVVGPQKAEWMRERDAEFKAWEAGTIFKPGTVIESKVAEAAGPSPAR